MAKIKKKIVEKVLSKKGDKGKKLNPFEVHINKQKYQVLGQKSKNDRGLPGVSRAKALKKRKRTLLPEYTILHKSNKFLDKRIGEKNYGMNEEERQMARFTAERIRHHNKKSIFNLADDEVLTHRGQTLNEIERFEDPRSEDEEDEDFGRKSGNLNDNFVEDAHFGGGVLSKTGKEGAKSHKDLIDQLISESKKRKAEKQKTKEQTLELTEKLDSEWKDLLPLVNKSRKNDTEEPRQKPDDYDKVMRELRFEARGHPTDRLKTEDEIAHEEKERLEKLERERLERMNGFTTKAPATKPHRSADDLDDNFNYDSDPDFTLAYDSEGKLLENLHPDTEKPKTEDPVDKESNADEKSEASDDENSSSEVDDDLSDLKAEESDSDNETDTKTAEKITKKGQKTIEAEENDRSDKNRQEKIQKRKSSKSESDESLDSDLANETEETNTKNAKKIAQNKQMMIGSAENDRSDKNTQDKIRKLKKSNSEIDENSNADSESESDETDVKIAKKSTEPKRKTVSTDGNARSGIYTQEKNHKLKKLKRESDESSDIDLDSETEETNVKSAKKITKKVQKQKKSEVEDSKRSNKDLENETDETYSKQVQKTTKKQRETKNSQSECETDLIEAKKLEKTPKKLRETKNSQAECIPRSIDSENLKGENFSRSNFSPSENNCEEVQTNKEQELNSENLDRELKLKKAGEELPYTYTLPESYEELSSLLEKHSAEKQQIIIERMIKCNHPSLEASNKEKLNRLFVYLLQHLNDAALDCFDPPETSQKVIHCFSLLNALAPEIFTLTQMDSSNAAESFVQILKEKHEEYRKKPKYYPKLDVLIFLKLISCLFSTSDFRHQIVTPSIVFLGQMLTKCRVYSRYHISYGLFLLTLFLEYTFLSRRYMGSALIYLMGILHMAVPKTGVKLDKIFPPFKPNSGGLVLTKRFTKDMPHLKMSAEDFAEEQLNENFKIRALYTALKLIEELLENWSKLSARITIFEPVLKLLEKIPGDNYPKTVQDQILKVKTLILESQQNASMDYIVLEKKRPKALRLYEPNVEKIFDGKKRRPMSREKAERGKLVHKYKKEMKGAVREIRRDQSFLGRVRIKQQVQRDQERREKVKRLYAEASIQQSELNEIDRKKRRK